MAMCKFGDGTESGPCGRSCSIENGCSESHPGLFCVLALPPFKE